MTDQIIATEYNFAFITNLQNRAFLVSAFKAITNCELWPWFNDFDSSNNFMFSSCSEIDLLRAELSKDRINGYHSGASYGFVLRQMEYIAKNGYEKYKSEYLQGCSNCDE
jgi:hypothetical protein